MSKKDEQRLDDARRASHGDLYKISSQLRGSSGERVQLGLLYNDMQGALHWALECWLGEPARLGWQDQEARFLRSAPDALRQQYLHVAGGATRLMTALHDLLGDDDVEQITIAAPSLADWRERALHWHSEAEALVAVLTGGVGKAHKRIERGALRGILDSLTPCLLLVNGRTRDERRRHAGAHAGIFHFGEEYMDDRPGRSRQVFLHSGMILPLALCSNASLRQKLMDFAQLVANPLADGAARSKPVGVSQRRADLQAWLNQHQLGCLRLLDREPTCPRVRFELVPEVFRDVLSHCEYVTAVSDQKGASTRVLEHVPFRFESYGGLLEWSDLDTRWSLHPISPFAFFLANDLVHMRDMFTGTWERKMMFRPPGYAMRFSVPDTSTPSVRVGIHFEDDDYGWVILRITLGEQNIEIDLSDVYDPFPSLLEWLQAISMNDMPIGFEIDEEGTEKALIAHAFDADRLLVAVLDKWDRTEFGAAVVDRDTFLAAFRTELNDFLRDPDRFDTESWNATDINGRESYWTELLSHSFLSAGP